MGFKSALVAMIIGNIIMFAYVGALGLLGTKGGMNFAPIGAVILVDQYVLRPNATIGADWRPLPFIAWGIGSVCAFVVEKGFPRLSTALSAAIVAGIAYYALAVAGVASEKAASTA
jgi:cytosine permease